MILIDAPYYNEYVFLVQVAFVKNFPLNWLSFFHRPGHGQANVKAPVSIAYNRNISMQTVKWAIVDWLQHKHRHGIWSVRPVPSVYLLI
jgi:hypothetical protein